MRIDWKEVTITSTFQKFRLTKPEHMNLKFLFTFHKTDPIIAIAPADLPAVQAPAFWELRQYPSGEVSEPAGFR